MRQIVFSFFLVGLFFWATPVLAQSTIPSGVKLHPQMQEQMDQGAEIHYIGTKYGLDGWLMRRGEELRYVYTVPGGKAFISGVLIDEDGTSITSVQIQDFIKAQEEDRLLTYQGTTVDGTAPMATPVATETAPPAPVSTEPRSAAELIQEIDQTNRQAEVENSPAEQLFKAIESSNWVAVGSRRAPVLYVFVEASCSYCHDYWEQARSFVDEDLVQLRLIPVALSQTGRATSAALLAADNPDQAWRILMEDEPGKVTPVPSDSRYLHAVDQNIALMYRWNLRGIPYSIYRDAAGVVKLIYDTPENMIEVLTDLTVKP